MAHGRVLEIGRPGRVAAAVAALAVLPLAAAPVSAAPRGSAPDGGAAGTISTIAGGAGGPGRGTTVSLPFACGVTYAYGHVYVSNSGAVRTLTGSGWLTPTAGSYAPGPLGNGGPATGAAMNPCKLAVDRHGNLLIADAASNMVRVVAHRTGTVYGQAMTAGHIYAVAGNGTRGSQGDGGPATAADLNAPRGVAVDGAGNLVIADTGSNRIRVVAASTGTYYGQAMKKGDIYTVAGNGSAGFSGDGGPAIQAVLNGPQSVAVDASGNLLIADGTNNRVRVVAASTGTFYGQAMTAGDIYTVAGGGTHGVGDGDPATQAELSTPSDVTVDGAGNLLIADTNNDRIRVVAARTGTFYGRAMTATHIYTVAGGNSGRLGNGGPATAARLQPAGVALDGSGNLLIADYGDNLLRVVAESDGTFYGQAMTTGNIYTVAGDIVAGSGTFGVSGQGGPATRAMLSYPNSVMVDPAGNVFISAYGDLVRVVPASTGTLFGRQVTAGHIYNVAGDAVPGFSGDGGPADRARLLSPMGMAVDSAGNLLIADYYNLRIRVVAAHTGTYYGQAMTAGDIYTIAGDGTAGFSGDGGPATAAELNYPNDVVLDGSGNALIADRFNNRIRVVAESTGTFYGQAMTAGDIYTIAGGGTGDDGGPATAAALDLPNGMTLDPAGNLVFADEGNNRVRVVAESTGTFYGEAMTTGDIYTVAGNGNPGYFGDGGPPTAAGMQPDSVAVDAAGNLVIADGGNNAIRVVAARTGTFYGKAMTGGNIYTVAGNGTYGFSGDGGPAIAAELAEPQGIALTPGGNLLFADHESDRVREVTGP